MKQLAWHCQQHMTDVARPWAAEVMARPQNEYYDDGPQGRKLKETALERKVSDALRRMRVPHIPMSTDALPGGIYKLPAAFPEPRAVLDIDAHRDFLASGRAGGTAELRRRQLKDRGW